MARRKSQAPPGGWPHKDATILSVITVLRSMLSDVAFDVIDYWPDDPYTIGIARAGELDPCVCILARDKEPERYDVEHAGAVFRDCLVAGIEAVVRGELKRSSHDPVRKRSARPMRGRIAPRWFTGGRYVSHPGAKDE